MTSEQNHSGWMIYPGVKSAIRGCALAFCICSAVVTLGHQLIPFIFYWATAATLFPLLMVLAGAGVITSLVCIVFWSARVLLASQGSYITRILSGAGLLPALYTLLVLLGSTPIRLKYTAIQEMTTATLLLAGITALFALPYTQGYSARGRKRLTVWAVLAVLYAIMESFAPLFIGWAASQNRGAGSQAAIFALWGVACGIIELILAVLSVQLGFTLFSRVTSIASMPERQNPVFPAKES